MHEEDEGEYEEPKGKQPQNSEGYMTQHEVAESLGISRAAVVAVEKRALRKFKYFLLKKYKEEDL